MRKLLAIVALLLASSGAQAQYTIEYGGRTIRIDPDRGTVSIPGVYDNTGRPSKRSKNDDSDRDGKRKPPQQAKSNPQGAPEAAAPSVAVAPAPAVQTPAPTTTTDVAPVAPTAAPATDPSTSTAAVAPIDAPAAPTPPAVNAPVPQVQQVPPSPAKSAPAPAIAAVPPAAPPAPAPVQVANSPLGVWLTEEKEGKVRIEECGANICGYAVDKKSNANGEQILINMKPGKDAKWSGRIFDPNSGSTYDSTIALKGDSLRVQGCAFGGMFCGGQTWTRVN